MLQFNINKETDRPLSLLFLGAHCDDIEIGCGGTILSLMQKQIDIAVHWAVFSSNQTRVVEAQKSANRFLADATEKDVIIKDFRNGFFPYIGAEIKVFFEELKQRVPQPDIIFTHFRHDLHQDHRIISELTWNTYRNHCILEYEIPKYDGDLLQPNFFVPINEAICQGKIGYLNECFPSQQDKQWFTDNTFKAILRLRGLESNSPSGLAEGFHCRKFICSFINK
jgi:LmbE family N-acetylglucosaminyl deacetylase